MLTEHQSKYDFSTKGSLIHARDCLNYYTCKGSMILHIIGEDSS